MHSLPAACRNRHRTLWSRLPGRRVSLPNRLPGISGGDGRSSLANPRRKHRISAPSVQAAGLKVNVNIGTSGGPVRHGTGVGEGPGPPSRTGLTPRWTYLLRPGTGGYPVERRLPLPGHIGRECTGLRGGEKGGERRGPGCRPPLQGHPGALPGGVDFLTLYTGVNLAALDALRRDPRIMGSSPGEGPSTSRGWSRPVRRTRSSPNSTT